MGRTDNTLSAVLRSAWDGVDLRVMTRKSSLRAKCPHVSIVSHSTKDDIVAEMDTTSIANGFGNRFLFALVRRSKLLPFGGALDDETTRELAQRTVYAIQAGAPAQRLRFDIVAERLWRSIYETLAAEQFGLYGAVTARAEAQVIRIALIYALLDQARAIGLAHLKAGLAVWRYCDASARYIFGDKTGDKFADAIISALRMAGPDGKTRTEIAQMFSHAVSSSRIEVALQKLLARKLIKLHTVATGRRPAMVYSV
jgi:Protein of unknown function (DUF3987)